MKAQPPPTFAPMEPVERYLSRPVRPIAQLLARAGLWGAVGVGCVGGVLGFVRPASPTPEPAAPVAVDDDLLVPAPVAGVAERAVEAWLDADQDDPGQLDDLFVHAPEMDTFDLGDLTVESVTTVAGRRLDDDYWAVTVAAAVTEAADGTGNGDGLTDVTSTRDPDQPAGATTWYVEVGIVGRVSDSLAALTTPAVVPPPAEVSGDWSPRSGSTRTPDANDPIVATVQGFLSSLLADGGDPSRYASPGVEITASDPAPFQTMTVVEMAIETLEDGATRAWTHVQATTPVGAQRIVAYELVLVERDGRWEVRDFSGVPSLAGSAPSAGDATATSSTSSPSSSSAPSTTVGGSADQAVTTTSTVEVDPSDLGPED